MIRNKELYLIRPRTIITKKRNGDCYDYTFDIFNEFLIARKKHHDFCSDHKMFYDTYFLLNGSVEIYPCTSSTHTEVGDIIVGQIVPISLYINKKFVTRKYLATIEKAYNEKFKKMSK